jgi:preprotein translocase subunit SecB
MNITLKGTKAEKLTLMKTPSEGNKFSFGHAFSEENSNNFLLIFDISINLEEDFLLDVTYLAEFETSEPIDIERDKKLLAVNAPAIAYPFLRSYIATVLLNSGHPSVMLPTVNFIELAKQQDQANQVQSAPASTNQ